MRFTANCAAPYIIMNKTPFKICGLMRPEDVRACCRLGAAVAGFVTEYPLAVPWNLTEAQCGALLPLVSPPVKSCIVTGGDAGKIIAMAERLRPSFVQLHYMETLEDTGIIAKALKPSGIGIIRSVPVSARARLELFGSEKADECVGMLCSAGVAAILADSRGPENAAEKGRMLDPGFFLSIKRASNRPVMIGGGITPMNCRYIVETLHPDMIDIMTGVETAPGVKSEKLIAEVADCL